MLSLIRRGRFMWFGGKDLDEIEKRYEWQSKAGLAVEKLTRQARELEPCIAESVRGALRFPRDIRWKTVDC